METLNIINSILLQADEPIRFFGIKLYDEDFLELLLRLTVNVFVSYFIVFAIYKPTRNDKEYISTYLIFSPIVFFICNLFSSADLSMGFAFGLFAVFSILRYRTTTIQVKEMTYIFIVIAIAVINALSTKKVSYIELFFTNMFIIVLAYFVERYFGKVKNESLVIDYEIIEHIPSGQRNVLIENLKKRLGRNVVDVEILEVNYLRDMAKLRVFISVEK